MNLIIWANLISGRIQLSEGKGTVWCDHGRKSMISCIAVTVACHPAWAALITTGTSGSQHVFTDEGAASGT